MEKKPTPKVAVLGPITPSVESVRSDVLEYGKLGAAADKYRQHEGNRYRDMWATEDDSIGERAAAQQLAMQNLIFTSEALRLAVKPESKALWSERFTQASSELYGVPDSEIVAQMLQEGGELEQPFERAAAKVREYFTKKYESVFASLEEGIQPGAKLLPEEVASRFQRAIEVLANEHDTDWKRWTIEMPDDKDSLSVRAADEVVVVGARRAAVPAEDLRGLFAHEILIHAQSGLNGRKVSRELQTGYPGYLDNQEGQGVFVEYALSGTISHKITDRYIDIAYALGQVDGESHTRAELVNRAMERALLRNSRSNNPKLFEDIEKEVYAHVNRMYRGSLGNEYVGVFTKDIAYYKGFAEVGGYIEQELEAGRSIDEVMEYMLQGKFDPAIPAHTAELERQKQTAQID